MIAKYGTAIGLIVGGILAGLVGMGILTEDMAFKIGGAIVTLTGGVVMVAKYGSNGPSSMRGYCVAAFLMLAGSAQAATYVEDFETFPPGPIVEPFDLGDRVITITGAKAIANQPGPYGWGMIYLTPIYNHYACVTRQTTVAIDQPVYAIAIEVTSVAGRESFPPITTCYADDYSREFSTGPGLRYATWPHNRAAGTGWGYAFISNDKQVPIINRCVVVDGDVGKVKIQTHPLTPVQLQQLRSGGSALAVE